MTEPPAAETSAAETLRLLVACGACGLQFDASELPQGHRFRCACGELVEVPPVRPQSADVVRCSSCGAPRDAGHEACGYCGSGFTLHERDLHTLCPACMTRISDRARYCHACATPIAPQARAGELTERACPACGADRILSSRRIESDRVSVLECGRCAGLWLGADVFRLLEERARARQAEWTPAARGRGAEVAADRPVYRRCAICGTLMHRRNYGRRSGVIVDVCAEHGLWFDRGELDRILRWIRDGGLLRAEAIEATARRDLQRHRASPLTQAPDRSARGAGGLADLIAALLDAF